MEKGQDFLRAQVNNAIMLHKALVENITSHADQAEDLRFRELCDRHLPKLRSHQRMLEDYGRTLGADGSGGLKGIFGQAMAKARDVVDAARETDFLRVVADVVMIRQAQDTFATFAHAGSQLGDNVLAQLGRECEKDHEAMQRDFNNFTRDLFVAHVRGFERTDAMAADTTSRI